MLSYNKSLLTAWLRLQSQTSLQPVLLVVLYGTVRNRAGILVVFYQKMAHAVAQLVGAMRHKPESRGFDSRLCHRNFSLTSFWPHCGPGVDSASNRNEYQEYFVGGKGGRCVGLTTLPPSCAECLNPLEPLGPVQACNGIDLPFYHKTTSFAVLDLSRFVGYSM